MFEAPEYSEVSVPIGGLLVTIGLGIWVGNYYLEMFTSWGWAILLGSVFVVIGYLFFYSDWRVYVGERTVTEEFLRSDEDDVDSQKRASR